MRSARYITIIIIVDGCLKRFLVIDKTYKNAEHEESQIFDVTPKKISIMYFNIMDHTHFVSRSI